MANYTALKAAIQAAIYENGNNEITGAVLQQSLLSMITSLGDGYQFMGVATPKTNPGTPDEKIFYLAGSVGDYVNFGLTVTIPGIYIFIYDTEWTAITLLQLNASLELAVILEDGLNFVDNYMNIGVKIDTNGIDAINLLTIEPI